MLCELVEMQQLPTGNDYLNPVDSVMGRAMRDTTPREFWARITDRDGSTYAFQEVMVQDDATATDQDAANYGVVGDGTNLWAVEAAGRTDIPIDAIVRMVPSPFAALMTFDGGRPSGAFAKITGTASVNIGGVSTTVYSAKKLTFTPSSTWTDGIDIYIRNLAGGMSTGSRYVVFFQGLTDAGDEWYIGESDADEVSGTAYAGLVGTGTQYWNGYKIFRNDVTVLPTGLAGTDQPNAFIQALGSHGKSSSCTVAALAGGFDNTTTVQMISNNTGSVNETFGVYVGAGGSDGGAALLVDRSSTSIAQLILDSASITSGNTYGMVAYSASEPTYPSGGAILMGIASIKVANSSMRLDCSALWSTSYNTFDGVTDVSGKSGTITVLTTTTVKVVNGLIVDWT